MELTPTDGLAGDLDPAVLAAELPGRPVRSYPALLSTEATAQAWARQGAPAGSVVVANYQASPRGRAGLVWSTHPGAGLGFTLVLDPELPPEREGWPYVAALLALHDVVGAVRGGLAWPDEVHGPGGTPLARLGAHVELGPARSRWVTVTVLVEQAAAPRAALLAELVRALEHRFAAPPGVVLADYLARCDTLGRRWRARLIPMGPGGPEVIGEAVDVLADGALVLRTDRGHRVAVPPQNLGLLEPPAPPEQLPERLFGGRPL